ncbi:MAG: urea carboxylase-associated family protein [Verrucomicrobia bacterium]|nr:urea carboxylase-associated family protein [Verrucomicrobiota bacterium]
MNSKPPPALKPEDLRFRQTVPGGANWSHVLKRGTTLRLRDPEGGVNVSAIFFNFELLSERLNVPDTLKAQHTAKLTAGHCLYSDMGRILVSIPRDNLGWHDPLAGHSTREIVNRNFGTADFQSAGNRFHRNARDNFLMELGKYGLGLQDLVMNVNFFGKVTVDGKGALQYCPDHSRPGACVELRAEMNTLVILNTCPHPLHPGGDYAPPPLELAVYSSPTPGPDDICRLSRPENTRGFEITERYFL